MKMKCPEIEKIYMYIDNELDVAQMNSIKAHIQSCKKCREIVNGLIAEEDTFRSIANELFAAKSVKNKVMAEINNIKLKPEITKENEIEKLVSFTLLGRFKKFFAFSFVIVVIAILSFIILRKNFDRHYSCSVSLNCVAANSTVDNVRMSDFELKQLNKFITHRYNGTFVFTVKARNFESKLSWVGDGILTFTKEHKIIVVGKTKGCIKVISGDFISCNIGSKTLQIGYKPVGLCFNEDLKKLQNLKVENRNNKKLKENKLNKNIKGKVKNSSCGINKSEAKVSKYGNNKTELKKHIELTNNIKKESENSCKYLKASDTEENTQYKSDNEIDIEAETIQNQDCNTVNENNQNPFLLHKINLNGQN